MEYNSDYGAYEHDDYPNLIFERLTTPPCDDGYEHMVEHSFVELPNDVDDVFATAAEQVGNELTDQGGHDGFETLHDRFAYDDRTVLDYDRFFLQFGLVTQGVNTFGSPFVQVYGGRPKDDA